MKIIKKEDYIEKEEINTIAMIESKNILTKGEVNNNKILFDLKNQFLKNISFYANVFSIIISNFSDIEYISYDRLEVNAKFKSQKEKLIFATLITIGFAFLIIFISFIRYCSEIRHRRNMLLDDVISVDNDILRGIDYTIYSDI